MPTIQFGLLDQGVIGLTPEQRTARELVLAFSVGGLSNQQYLNLKPPRHRGFYGYALLMYGEYVSSTIELQYINQLLYADNDCCQVMQDAIACGVKALNPTLSGYITKRNRLITSVRYRLSPGVFGNMAISWIPVTSECDNTIREPAPEQGTPPNPSNSPLPSGQNPEQPRLDPYDNTGNDGEDPNAPAPEEIGPTGTWKITITYGPPYNQPETKTFPGRASDRFRTSGAPKRTDAACTEARLNVLQNGNIIFTTDNCTSPITAVSPFTYTPSTPTPSP